MSGMDKNNASYAGKKHFLLPALTFGALFLLIAVVIRYETLPYESGLRPSLAVIAGLLTLAFMLLLSFWLAGRPSRPAHAAAVLLRIFYCLILFAMACQVFRDIEIRIVTPETWINTGIVIAGILAINGKKILSAFHRKAFSRRADHVVSGRICQIMGETHLDRDGDPVTVCHALIDYAVDGKPYKTRADISRYTIRKYGRDAFVGQSVPVFYDQADPASSVVRRIDRHFFDKQAKLTV